MGSVSGKAVDENGCTDGTDKNHVAGDLVCAHSDMGGSTLNITFRAAYWMYRLFLREFNISAYIRVRCDEERTS